MFVSYFNGFETKKKSKYKVDFNFIIISFKKDKNLHNQSRTHKEIQLEVDLVLQESPGTFGTPFPKHKYQTLVQHHMFDSQWYPCHYYLIKNINNIKDIVAFSSLKNV